MDSKYKCDVALENTIISSKFLHQSFSKRWFYILYETVMSLGFFWYINSQSLSNHQR